MMLGSSTDNSCLHGADSQNNLRLYILFHIFVHYLSITLTAAAFPWFQWFCLCEYSVARYNFGLSRVSYLKVIYFDALLH